MDKRRFIKTSGLIVAGTGIIGTSILSCKTSEKKEEEQEKEVAGDFELPELPYGFQDLEPYIDRQTMEIHYTKHHAGYVKKLNETLKNSPMKGKSLVDILKNLQPKEEKLRNNAGGHYNHTLFWSILSPEPQTPGSTFKKVITDHFETIDLFKQQFVETAKSVFGSGWTWLNTDKEGKLYITSTPNQDNPLMANIIHPSGHTPLLGLDVWEHAYYLKYQNRREEYINNFFNIINWKKVEENYNQTQSHS